MRSMDTFDVVIGAGPGGCIAAIRYAQLGMSTAYVDALGPDASESIAEAVPTMAFGARTENLVRTVHAHPTLAEAPHEAARANDDRRLQF